MEHYPQLELLFWLATIVAFLGLAVDSTVRLKPRPRVQLERKMSLDRFFLVKASLLAVCMVCFGASFGVLSNYLAIYGKEVLGITSGTGTWFALLAVGLMMSRLQGAKALREGRLSQNAAGGMLISLLGYTAFWGLTNSWGYYGSALLIGLGNGHMWPAMQNMFINLAHNSQRGTANSSILISWDIGIGLGVLLGGMLTDAAGYGAAFATAAAINLVGVITYFTVARSHFERNKLR